MKRFQITYHLLPESENVVIIVSARTYEDACIYAKEYRHEAFSIVEI